MSAAPAETSAPGRRIIRQAILVWLVAAFCNSAAQIFLRRELAPGEFGTMNTLLGVVAVLTAPLLALDLVFVPRPPDLAEASRWLALRPVLMETATLVWSGVSLVLLFVFLPLLGLPRLSLHFFTILAVGASLLAVLSSSLCATSGHRRFWIGLFLAAAAVRLLASAFFAHLAPWAQAGLAAFIVAGIITAIPALQARTDDPSRSEAWALLREGRFFVPFLATASVVFAVTLFTNADRIVAQLQFGVPNEAQMGYIDWRRFDDYQTAGLCARALLWGTLPVLMLFRTHRLSLASTTTRSLRILWIYLGLLIAGEMLLVFFAPVLSWLFTGDPLGASRFIPGFAGATFTLGLLQGIAIFALASRRYPECFLLGACSIAYLVFLDFYGRQPELMTTCMFGGALISLMLVLIVGVVRYARTHP